MPCTELCTALAKDCFVSECLNPAPRELGFFYSELQQQPSQPPAPSPVPSHPAPQQEPTTPPPPESPEPIGTSACAIENIGCSG